MQKIGEPIQVIRPGDTVFIAPGEKHWHGATWENLMIPLALQEAGPDGQTTTWLEPVSDAVYGK